VKAKILWVEGKKMSDPALISSLRKKGHTVEIATSVKTGLEIAHQMEPDMVVVFAPSLRVSSRRVCHSFSESLDGQPILLISQQEENDLETDGISEVLITPVTTRKILACVHRLIPGTLKAGSITLNLDESCVLCDGRQQRLTPRLVKLLQKLMQHPGEVIERKKLFASVWNTDYTDDTRTLDVHISWLRRVIEVNPKDPKFIITIRGVGYRLDV